MMPARTLIVDDEPTARAAIRQLLRGIDEIEVVGEARNGLDARRALEAGGIDLVFLDVQMPVLSGIDVLTNIDPESMPIVVFVTAFHEYAMRAFDFHAIDYLLKPFTDDRFYEAVRRAIARIRDEQGRELTERMRSLMDEFGTHRREKPMRAYLARLAIRAGYRVTLVAVRDVDWIGSDGDYAVVHVRGKAHLLRETMRSMASSLDPENFARIHRSAIVNLDRIKELRGLDKGEYGVFLLDGTELKLSRGYKDSFETQLGRRI